MGELKVEAVGNCDGIDSWDDTVALLGEHLHQLYERKKKLPYTERTLFSDLPVEIRKVICGVADVLVQSKVIKVDKVRLMHDITVLNCRYAEEKLLERMVGKYLRKTGMKFCQHVETGRVIEIRKSAQTPRGYIDITPDFYMLLQDHEFDGELMDIPENNFPPIHMNCRPITWESISGKPCTTGQEPSIFDHVNYTDQKAEKSLDGGWFSTIEGEDNYAFPTTPEYVIIINQVGYLAKGWFDGKKWFRTSLFTQDSFQQLRTFGDVVGWRYIDPSDKV